MKIGELRIGDEVKFGGYSVGCESRPRKSIVWVKADKDTFISKEVLDYLPINAYQNVYPPFEGNGLYKHSSLYRYLNSDQYEWAIPAYEGEALPSRTNCTSCLAYSDRPGFLNAFTEYEKSCLLSDIDLPSVDDLFGEKRLRLFKRCGVRAIPSFSLRDSYVWRLYGEGRQYSDFWLRDVFGVPVQQGAQQSFQVLNRSGHAEPRGDYYPSGVRPVCRINPDTTVNPIRFGYKVVDQEILPGPEIEVATEEELMRMLGLM